MALKVQALFKGASKAKAPEPAAKKAVVKPSGTKSTRGWLGGAGGAQNLDKWYGEFLLRPLQGPLQPSGARMIYLAQIVLDLGSNWQLMPSAGCLWAATNLTVRVLEQRTCLLYRCRNLLVNGSAWRVRGSLQPGHLGWCVSWTD